MKKQPLRDRRSHKTERENKYLAILKERKGILNVSLINKNGCFEGCSDYCTNSALIVRENESKTKAEKREEEGGRAGRI